MSVNIFSPPLLFFMIVVSSLLGRARVVAEDVMGATGHCMYCWGCRANVCAMRRRMEVGRIRRAVDVDAVGRTLTAAMSPSTRGWVAHRKSGRLSPRRLET